MSDFGFLSVIFPLLLFYKIEEYAFTTDGKVARIVTMNAFEFRALPCFFEITNAAPASYQEASSDGCEYKDPVPWFAHMGSCPADFL